MSSCLHHTATASCRNYISMGASTGTTLEPLRAHTPRSGGAQIDPLSRTSALEGQGTRRSRNKRLRGSDLAASAESICESALSATRQAAPVLNEQSCTERLRASVGGPPPPPLPSTWALQGSDQTPSWAVVSRRACTLELNAVTDRPHLRQRRGSQDLARDARTASVTHAGKNLVSEAL